MSRKQTIDAIIRNIRELTLDVETSVYAEMMAEIAQWCNDQSRLAAYEDKETRIDYDPSDYDY